MGLFTREVTRWEAPKMELNESDMVTDKEVIEYLRNLTPEKYNELKQIVDIYRDADEQIAIVKAGSKRKYQEQLKEQKKLAEEQETETLTDEELDDVMDAVGAELEE